MEEMNEQQPMQAIDAADLSYHAQVMEQVRAAQAVMQSWSVHLSQKYQLAQGDTVDPNGRIVRKVEP